MNTSRQDQSQLKNLDDIQETDGPQRTSRLGALLLASLGGACIVLSSVVLMKKPVSEASGAVDPLGALVEKSRSQPQAAPNDRPGIDVTFPGLLAGTERPLRASLSSSARSLTRPSGPGATTAARARSAIRCRRAAAPGWRGA